MLKEKSIKLAKVNCVDESDLCQSHGVQGYPQVFFFIVPLNRLLMFKFSVL